MLQVFKDAKNRKKLKGIDALELTPVKMQRHITRDGNLITVLIPRFNWQPMHNLMVKNGRDPDFHLDLDEIGTEVWNTIDGEKKVSEIGKILKEKFKDNDTIIERVSNDQSLVKFISMMFNNKLITFKELEN
ncbi:MAG: PqqD family protein [Ignavibacteriales bacterium]|nr:MAG: PqqD family protein [Ignavibacteriaceae bacterium]MBW7872899.1 PqqD family protein [Ignavibacteria bacterium]MCZ2142472.1 PqqD family protein [Ignavibacteriales bacterium]OQY76282.1 MAG: hypothetical protein B6D45_04060 [Ignavibacteriales bacterium UTCHB3]MBV6445354.1 hypothetical protein [Ignavibacteriaceae bacterium]